MKAEMRRPKGGHTETNNQVEVKLVIPPGRTLEVFGDRDSVLRRVEELVECEVVVRGNEIVLRGTEGAVERADDGGGREVLGDVILTHRGRRVAPKTRNQKAYTDAIRQHQVVFGIGPA